MEVLQRTANRGSISTGYDIDNSVKLEDANNEWFYNASPTAGNRRTHTFSFWIKRTEIGLVNASGNAFVIGQGQHGRMFFGSDYFQYRFDDGHDCRNVSRQFRDTSAWYHFVVAVDTNQSSAGNRVKLYVNGESLAVDDHDGGSYPDIEDQGAFFSTSYLTLGTAPFGGSFNVGDGDYDMSGYLAEFCAVDGQQLAPTDFGEFDSDSGIWKPIDVSGINFGNQGFYLNFATAGDLGDDKSGNGKDLTENNLAAADQATDTPTNNFCTLMPPQASITGTATVVSEGGTQMKGGSTAHQNAFGSIGVRSGKWYFESNVSNLAGVASYNFFFGVIAADKTTAISNGTAYFIGQIANTWGFTSNNRGTTGGTENPNFPSESATSGTTEVMGIALDMDNGKIWVHKAGTYATNNSGVTGNPATGAAPQYDNLLTSTDEHILVGGGVYTQTSAAQRNMNFGNPMNANFTGVGTHSDANGYGSFAYAPPSGYYALCTKNLAEYGG